MQTGKTIRLLAALLLLTSCSGWTISANARRSFNEGLALFNQGHYEEAIPHFLSATKKETDFAKAYLYLGRSYLNLGRWTEAVPPLRTAFRLSPAESQKEVLNLLFDSLFSAAQSEFKKGNYKSSVDLLKEGLKLEPESERIKANLVSSLLAFGGTSLAEGKAGDAITSFSEAVDLSPGNVQAYVGLARAFFHQGDVLKALQSVQKAIKIDPSNAEAQSLFTDLLK